MRAIISTIRTLPMLVVASFVALALLAGCATADGPGDSAAKVPATTTTSTRSTSSTTSTTSPGRDVRAVSVSFTRSGGIAGQTDSVEITMAKPPAGYNRARVRAILAAASRPALRHLKLPRMPQNLCCDLYVYTVRVSWSDGSARIFRTADGLRQPPQLRRLLAAVS